MGQCAPVPLPKYLKCIGVQKLTKAQKRREQRAAEEAERDARIEAEQAGQGSSERQEEAELLHLLLEPLGLAVKDIPVSHCPQETWMYLHAVVQIYDLRPLSPYL